MKKMLAWFVVAAMTVFIGLAYAEEDSADGQPEQLQEWIDVAHEVQYIGHRDVAHITPDNVQRIWFALLDENENQLASPAVVDIEIVNDNGEVVYDQRHYIDPSDYGTWTNTYTNAQNLLCSIDIPDEDILPGSAKTGVVNINVFYSTQPEFGRTFSIFSFSEYSDNVDNLPYNSPAAASSLEILEIPETVSYTINDRVSYTLAIEDVSFEFSDSSELGKVNLTISITGKKEFDSEGGDHSSECRIGIKLYQEEYVIESGTILTTSIAEGEGFRNASATYRGLEPGNYQLKIVDVER